MITKSYRKLWQKLPNKLNKQINDPKIYDKVIPNSTSNLAQWCQKKINLDKKH